MILCFPINTNLSFNEIYLKTKHATMKKELFEILKSSTRRKWREKMDFPYELILDIAVISKNKQRNVNHEVT